MRPAAIVNFERVFLVKIAIGVVGYLYLLSVQRAYVPPDAPPMVARAVPWMIAGGMVAFTLIDLLLLYLIARRGSNVARWVLAILFAFGVAGVLHSEMRYGAATPFPSMAAILFNLVLDAICVVLIFSRDASPWFRR